MCIPDFVLITIFLLIIICSTCCIHFIPFFNDE